MFTLSSRTRVFPSAHVGLTNAASVRHKTTALLILFGPRRVVPSVCFGDNVGPERLLCTAAVNVAILLQKSTSALAEGEL